MPWFWVISRLTKKLVDYNLRLIIRRRIIMVDALLMFLMLKSVKIHKNPYSLCTMFNSMVHAPWWTVRLGWMNGEWFMLFKNDAARDDQLRIKLLQIWCDRPTGRAVNRARHFHPMVRQGVTLNRVLSHYWTWSTKFIHTISGGRPERRFVD